MVDLLPGLFVLGVGLGLPMALVIDLALINISDKDQNSCSGFVSTGHNLGLSMGTAIIGVILVLGIVGGMHDVATTYDGDLTDAQFESQLDVAFEKLDTTNITDLKVNHTSCN